MYPCCLKFHFARNLMATQSPQSVSKKILVNPRLKSHFSIWISTEVFDFLKIYNLCIHDFNSKIIFWSYFHILPSWTAYTYFQSFFTTRRLCILPSTSLLIGQGYRNRFCEGGAKHLFLGPVIPICRVHRFEKNSQIKGVQPMLVHCPCLHALPRWF